MIKLKNSQDASATMLERMPVAIKESEDVACMEVASDIARLIIKKQKNNETAVLGLATGVTPIKIYQELVRKHREEGLSFKNVVTFNLDEYYPQNKTSKLSYYYFMHHHLFDHIDIRANVNIPDGEIESDKITDYCKFYEEKIDAYGGIDIQILGIGRTGHIGFNEPGSRQESLTRLVKLHPVTIIDATREFIREEQVPRRAITMGIKTISKARKVYLLAWGEKKAPILKEAIEGGISEEIPATFLQNHPNVAVMIDSDAAVELTRIKTPWVVSVVEWDIDLAKSAVIWLGQKLEKPILKLTEDDYRKNGLGDLLGFAGDSQKMNVKIFNSLQHTITGWPGGKPNSDDTHRPERAQPTEKRVVIFSPHPDDDVISMGGTFRKLVKQGHDVHVAYQVSGNIAVFDDDARKYGEFMRDLSKILKIAPEDYNKINDEIVEGIESKEESSKDTELIRAVKGLIRKGEASAGARFIGLNDENIHFLNLPFYETGEAQKNVLGPEDIGIIKDLLLDIQPHQIFAAGDLRDPHGTHKVCFDAILMALNELKDEAWIKDCWLWMYRGAWHEWETDEIEMAIPLSPVDLLYKRKAIFKHQSQKDSPVFPGNDPREFWQRAEDRNRQTARYFDQLGLTEYEAIEAFVRYHY